MLLDTLCNTGNTPLRKGRANEKAAAFVFTSMVGSGIFTVPAFVRDATGSGPATLGVWAAGAVLALCGAVTYAELAVRSPRAGGEYRFLAEAFGPLFGFLSGWVSFFAGFSAAIAASSLGAIAYAAPLLPGWDIDAAVLPGIPINQGAVAAAVLVLILAVVHAMGVRVSGDVQLLVAATVLGSISLLVVGGLLTDRGSWHGVLASGDPSSSWWVALLQVSFAYSGWNAAAYMAGEVREPARNLPRALVGGTLLVGGTYLALNVLFLYALPAAGWNSQLAVGQDAALRLFGTCGAALVTALITLAIFGSVSANVAVGPRVYFAMARDGLSPRAVGRLARRSGAPTVALMAQGTFAALLALTGAFEALLIYIGAALLLFAGLTVAAIFVVRSRDRQKQVATRPPVLEPSYRVPLYPLPPLIFLAMAMIALTHGIIERPVPTGAAFAMIAAGAVIYALSGVKYGPTRS